MLNNLEDSNDIIINSKEINSFLNILNYKIRILKLIIIFFFFKNIFNSYFIYNKPNVNNKTNFNDIFTKINYDDILPKISLKNNSIPSIEDIFNSRELFIYDTYLTRDYIKFIRPINEIEEVKYKKKYSENEEIISPEFFKKRKDQYNYLDFAKLCLEEKLLDSNKIEYNKNPLISIILPTYNKENILIKSIRSIQNQSFKNIEIIIVNDCSTDNSTRLFSYLLDTEPRIRIFNQLKNMGVWKSRLNGILYSRGKYILLFDPGDLYEDNYVLEDAFNLIENYKLDSVKMIFRIIDSFDNLIESNIKFHVYNNSKITYGTSNIEKFNNKVFDYWGNIWNRIVRNNIYIKGLYLLNNFVLNIYKNVWDDEWYNSIINKVSYSFLIVERVSYIYMMDLNGEGSPKKDTEIQKDKIIKEYLAILYFEHNLLPVNDNKRKIIKILKKYDNKYSSIKLNFIKTKFHVLYNLIYMLLKDPFVSKAYKIFLEKLLKKYHE